MLRSLENDHSTHKQVKYSLARGGIICNHPATGEKAVYVNLQCMLTFFPFPLLSPLRHD